MFNLNLVDGNISRWSEKASFSITEGFRFISAVNNQEADWGEMGNHAHAHMHTTPESHPQEYCT